MNTPILSSPEIRKFRSSVPLQQSLKAALEQPEIKAALEAIASTVLPRSIPDTIPGNHPDTAIAHQYYRMFGVQQVLSTLEAMTVPSGKHKLDNEGKLSAFEDSLPDEYADPLPPSERLEK
jgi:lipoprotein-anchoring transpeptidase ErfK/SrfK